MEQRRLQDSLFHRISSSSTIVTHALEAARRKLYRGIKMNRMTPGRSAVLGLVIYMALSKTVDGNIFV
jgi:hypothetical protein